MSEMFEVTFESMAGWYFVFGCFLILISLVLSIFGKFFYYGYFALLLGMCSCQLFAFVEHRRINRGENVS